MFYAIIPTLFLCFLPTSHYIFIVYLVLFMSQFCRNRCMLAWAEICHLSQSSKSILTGFLGWCMQYWLIRESLTCICSNIQWMKKCLHM